MTTLLDRERATVLPDIRGTNGRALAPRSAKSCRFCGTPLEHRFVDLGMSPLANAYLRPEDLDRPELFYPLVAYVCGECLLVQLEQWEAPEAIFSDYAYFSSYSQSWLDHAQRYVDDVAKRFGIGASSHVVEIASNDGYLLQYFLARNVRITGIEPAENVADAARRRGIPTISRFFGEAVARELVREGVAADLLIGNNVLAHVPDVNDFVRGLKIILAPSGVITMEFPHLMRLMMETQLDTIYHEHFSYLSLMTVEEIFAARGLTIFDVEELPTHGGSLRIYARHRDDRAHDTTSRVADLRRRELNIGLRDLAAYLRFSDQIAETKCKLLEVLIQAKRSGKRVAGYGAPAKGNTLLNYCGIRSDYVEFTVDASPHKQGLFLPGTRIPIEHPDRIRDARPDYVLILPWNLKREIMQQLSFVRSWGGKFIIPIPTAHIVD
jgi:SAM-dependent methyltransferase